MWKNFNVALQSVSKILRAIFCSGEALQYAQYKDHTVSNMDVAQPSRQFC